MAVCFADVLLALACVLPIAVLTRWSAGDGRDVCHGDCPL